MAEKLRFAVVELDELAWPASLRPPGSRFRLFIAGDTNQADVDEIALFAEAALGAGAVYVCAWGPGCGRFHDIVDEVVVEDAVSDARRFTPPTDDDVIITASHGHESLREALEFFVNCAVPTVGYRADSDYHLVVCVGQPEWATTARRFMEAVPFLP